MTANDSSSSAARSTDDPSGGDPVAVDLVAEGLLPPLPRAYLEGRDLDLLAPYRLLAPGGDLEAVPERRHERATLAAELGTDNASWGHPRARELAERLADPATRVVVTGQQPGLFGGPLYSLSKMVAAARWAAALEAAGQPAVAVFWVATEDHDWTEVARAAFLGRDGLERFRLGDDDPDPLLPVGMRTLGPAVESVLDAVAELALSERFEDWVETLRGIWRPSRRFGEAFTRHAVELLGERCPLLLDSMAPAVRRAEAPHLRRLVEERAALDEATAAAHEAIAERGHPLQVSPQPGVSPLFLLRGGERRRIVWEGDDGFSLRGGGGERSDGEAGTEPVERLLEILDDNPGAVSPGVLARPALQDAILGTALFVVGPGELSYLAQAAPAHRVLGLEAPAVALRPQVLVLESHHRDKLEETGVPLAALLGDDEVLERALAAGERTGFVDRARERLEAAFEELREGALELDPNLERPWEKTRDNALRSLDTFAGKVTKAAARRDEIRARRIDRLRTVVAPGGVLQERAVSTSHFPGKYGEGFVDALWEQMELDGRRLQVVEP